MSGLETRPTIAAPRPASPPRRYWRPLVLCGLMWGLAAIPLLQNVSGPYTGHFEINSAWMSSAARNYLVHGYAGTRLAVADNDGDVPPEFLRYYMSHPPLVPLLVSVSFHAFGAHEWAARLVPILFTLVSIVLIQRLGAALGGSLLGWVAAFLFALMPMNAYFGRVVNYEPVTLCFTLGASLAYLHWLRGGGRRWLAALLVLFVFSALADWPGYYLALVLPAHYVLSTRRLRDRRILLLPALAILLFGVHLAHVTLIEGRAGIDRLVDKFVYRAQLTAPPVDGTGNIGIQAFVRLEARRAYALFTFPVLVLAGVALLDLRRRLRAVSSDAAAQNALFLLTLLGFAALHVLLFRQGAWIHDYWLFYFGAPLALLAAQGALSLTTSETRARTLGVVGLVFLIAAWPQIRALHGTHAPIVDTADLIQQTSGAGDLILANRWTITNRTVGWHAARFVHVEPVLTLPQLVAVTRELQLRSLAYYRSELEPIDPELEAWLEAHGATAVGRLIGEGETRVYRVPGIAPALATRPAAASATQPLQAVRPR